MGSGGGLVRLRRYGSCTVHVCERGFVQGRVQWWHDERRKKSLLGVFGSVKMACGVEISGKMRPIVVMSKAGNLCVECRKNVSP